MITRDFANNGQFSVTDWTEELNVIPNQWGTINDLNIFGTESTSTHVVQFEEILKDGAIIVDRVRGERSNQNRDYTRKIHTFNIPHFPFDDAIYPQDIQGQRAYGSATGADTLDAVRGRKLERIAQNHSWTLEFARSQAITAGTAYAPNGTVTQDWYQEFTGTTRPTAIDFLFGTGTTEVIGKIEQAIAQIQDNSGSVSITGIICLTSPEFFAKLISHATVKQAYQYYSSTQEPLRMRLAAAGSATAMHREFYHGGVRFIEMRDTYNGVRLIPTGMAYFLPTGTEFFKTYFSPANRFGIVNTPGERMYMFENMSPNGTAYDIATESNHISALLKPLLVVAATSST